MERLDKKNIQSDDSDDIDDNDARSKYLLPKSKPSIRVGIISITL